MQQFLPIIQKEDTDGDGIFDEEESIRLCKALHPDCPNDGKGKDDCNVKALAGKPIDKVCLLLTLNSVKGKAAVKARDKAAALLAQLKPVASEKIKSNTFASHPELLAKITDFVAWMDTVDPANWQELPAPKFASQTLESVCDRNGLGISDEDALLAMMGTEDEFMMMEDYLGDEGIE